MTKEYATIGPIDPESGFASVHIGTAHVADAMLDGEGLSVSRFAVRSIPLPVGAAVCASPATSESSSA